MSKYRYEGYGVIRDVETDFQYHTDEIAELLEEKDQQIEGLVETLEEKEVIEKALKLACETLEDINFKLYDTEMNFIDYFKQEAKEILDNE